MANYRQIHVSIWKDDWFLELEPDEKLFFVYVFSNELASLSGLYKLPLRVMAFETGLTIEQIKTFLAKFEQAEKVYYEDGLIWVKSLRKYNQGGGTVQTKIQNDLNAIPHCKLKGKYLLSHPENIPYGYHIDRVSYEMKCNEMKCNGEEEEPARPRKAPPVPPSATPPPPSEPDEPKDPTPQQAFFGVLAEVTGMDGKLNAKRLGKAASSLSKQSYSPEFIRAHYGPGAWWYLSDWRGKKGELPTPEQIIETIGRVTLTPTTNGFHPPGPPVSTAHTRSKQALARAMQEPEPDE